MKSEQIDLRVANLDCDSEAEAITRGLRREPGIVDVRVWPKAARLHVTYDAETMNREAIEGRLRRLRTDYIDLYQCHTPDLTTPIEETMDTLATLVRAGKVRYIGCSNFSGSRIAEAEWAAAESNGVPFVSLQSRYSLVYRSIETDALPTAQRHGLGLLAYSPLAGGVLTGKYRRGAEAPADSRAQRVAGQKPTLQAFRRAMTNDRNMDIADAVREVAAEIGSTSTSVALAWVRSRPGVTSVIIGPRTFEQYQDYFAGFELTLAPEVIARLDETTALPALAA